MVLAVTTAETIFKLVLDDVVLGNKKYTAPYREDHTAQCYFDIGRTGDLHFVDFADPNMIRKDCFGFIGACYNLDYDSTMRYIDQQLGLGLASGDKIIPDFTPLKPKYKLTKKEKIIRKAPREFELRDRDFWYNQYGITRAQLASDGVTPVKCYQFESKTGETCNITPFDICYAYTEFANNKMKIYRPMGSSEQKWLTNCNQNDIGSIAHVDQSSDYIVVTKSYKDCRVLRNEGLNTVWFQNEGMIPDVEHLQQILLFKTIYIWFDNDQSGLAATHKVRERFIELGHKDVKTIIIPIPLRTEHGVKDPADLRKHNPQKLKEIIHTKIHNYAYNHSKSDSR